MNSVLIQACPPASLASGGGPGSLSNPRAITAEGGRLVNSNAPTDLPCYSVFFSALAPAATATDIVIFVPVPPKIVKIRRAMVTGTATAAASLSVRFLTRTTLDTGGTTAGPTQYGRFDSTMATSTTAIAKYTANAAALGTLEAIQMVQNLGLTAVAAVLPAVPIDLFFGVNCAPVTLRGGNDTFAINLNGAAIPAGTALDIIVWWTEES